MLKEVERSAIGGMKVSMSILLVKHMVWRVKGWRCRSWANESQWWWVDDRKQNRVVECRTRLPGRRGACWGVMSTGEYSQSEPSASSTGRAWPKAAYQTRRAYREGLLMARWQKMSLSGAETSGLRQMSSSLMPVTVMVRWALASCEACCCAVSSLLSTPPPLPPLGWLQTVICSPQPTVSCWWWQRKPLFIPMLFQNSSNPIVQSISLEGKTDIQNGVEELACKSILGSIEDDQQVIPRDERKRCNFGHMGFRGQTRHAAPGMSWW